MMPPSSPAAAVAVACLALCAHVRQAAAACTKGGGELPLTSVLYAQGRSTYINATCIPDEAFHVVDNGNGDDDYFYPDGSNGYLGDVAIEGLPFLKSIGRSSFKDFAGRLTFTGEYPRLATIEDGAFEDAGSTSSAVVFDQGLPALTSFGYDCFKAFGGKITIDGAFPRLATIEKGAFEDAGSASSAVAFERGLPALTSFGEGCFAGFNGKMKIGGAFPRLVTIGKQAFSYTETASSAVAFEQGLPALTSFGEDCFRYFEGKMTIDGAFPLLASIEKGAFEVAGSESSAVTFPVGLPRLVSVGPQAFWKGTFTFGGKYPALRFCTVLPVYSPVPPTSARPTPSCSPVSCTPSGAAPTSTRPASPTAGLRAPPTTSASRGSRS